MFTLATHIVTAVMRFNHRWLPSHRIVAKIRTRGGLRWGLPAAALGVAYMFVSAALFGLVDYGAPVGLNLVNLLVLIGGMRLIAHGLVAAVKLLVVRAHERLQLTIAVHQENRDRRALAAPPVSHDEARDALTEYRRQLTASTDYC